MKPIHSNRTKAYYRHHRKRVINRKRIITKYVWFTPNEQYGRLSKGKIHCSCQYCTEKTSLNGHKHSDTKKILSLTSQIHDYLV